MASATQNMKTILSFIALTGSVATFATAVALPAAAQWATYGLSHQQIEFQRGYGWSGGDYFGPRSGLMTQRHLA